MDKKLIIALVLKRLSEILENQRESYEQARDTAIKAEGRMQSRYDITKEDMSCLAAAHEDSMVRTQEAIDFFKELRAEPGKGVVGVGSLVVLQRGADTERYLLSEKGGGLKVQLPEGEVAILTTISPLGKALIGHLVGEEVEFETPLGKDMLRILEVV